MDHTGFIALGRVAKPHGLNGEFSMICHVDSPSIFDDLSCVFLALKSDRPKKFPIRSWRPHRGGILLRLKGLDGRDLAEHWRGADILARKRDLPDLEEDEVYLHQLVGVDVYLENGEPLGRVRDFLETPGQEVWVLKGPGGEEIFLPVVEEFIVSVDLDNNKVVAAPPEGLLDLYLKSE